MKRLELEAERDERAEKREDSRVREGKGRKREEGRGERAQVMSWQLHKINMSQIVANSHMTLVM